MGNIFSHAKGDEPEIDKIPGSFADDRGNTAEENDTASDLTQRRTRDTTENDSIIAALLAEESDSEAGLSDEAPNRDEAETGRSHHQRDHRRTDDNGDADEVLQVMIALAIVDSMDDMEQSNSTTTTDGSSTASRQADGAATQLQDEPTCPICTHELSSDPETGEAADEAPLRTFCPACTQAYHNACLSRWFNEDRDSIVCPTCRTEMEEDFVDEVRNL